MEQLKRKISDKTAKVCFVGLGKMGLPCALMFAGAGFKVTGVDINRKTVESVKQLRSPYLEPGLEELLKKTKNNFSAVLDYSVVSEADVVLCAVPTTINEQKHVDYSVVEEAFAEIGKYLKKGALVVFESNVTPGTTETLVRENLESAQKLTHGKDYLLAYVPIQGKAGKMLEDLAKYPRVVSGLTDEARDLAALLFKATGNEVDLASSIRVCELQKLFANIYKDINLAIANELAEYCERQRIDVREVIKYVNYWPGINLFVPDIGVGGNCLPVDPYFYLDHAAEIKCDARLPKIAREINDSRPQKLAAGIAEYAKKNNLKTIVLYGGAFRANTHETAYSPALEVYTALKAKALNVKVFDPLVGEDRLKERKVDSASKEEAEKADLRVLLVEHNVFKGCGAKSWREFL
ncbi:nucleotide sugar dehydrogenase [Candidatus Micrarchaeota archaeon]|nr:nucleotide sugar dehydrogenase [Candidatus Micrarchaeota archaeon]